MSRKLFSASSVLGSRVGSVGVGVSGCSGAAWVWNNRVRSSAPSLALAVPTCIDSASVVRRGAASLAGMHPSCSVSVRSYRGRYFLRIRGSRSVLLGIARWWSGV